MTVVLTLPYPLSANRLWRNARGRMIPSKEGTAYKAEVARLARAAGFEPVPGRVAVVVRLYPSLPRDHARRRRVDPAGWDESVRCLDLDNALKATLDALNGVAWHDDSQIRRIEAHRMVPDGEARAEIEVARA